MPNTLRALLWESMLDADMNVRYWGYLGRKYSRRETYIKVFLAIVSTTSAVGSWSLWRNYPEDWKALISVSALIAIALPILNYSGLVEKVVDQKGKWTRLLSEHAIAQTSRDDATIPLDEGLRRRMYEEVYSIHESQS